MRGVRGSILLSVMALALLLLVFAFLVAGQSLMDLGFANQYRQAAATDEVARSAVTQFLSEARRAPDLPDYWLTRFQSPVFPDGGSRLPGQAAITFDTVQPFHSVDNSAQDIPGASFFDKGSGRKSVPPFGMSLVITVNAGAQPAIYEAVLQKRWPYVLTAPLNLSVLCTFFPQKRPGGLLEGNVLRLQSPAGVPTDPLDLPQGLFDRAFNSRPLGMPKDGVYVGADCTWKGHLRSPAGTPPLTVGLGKSPGNLSPPLPDGVWSGRQGTGAAISGLDKMLALPDPAGFVNVAALPPLDIQKIGALVQVMDTSYSPARRQFVTLSRLHFRDGDYLINGDTSNTPAQPLPGDAFKQAGITLTNARLYVNGDLTLHDRTTGDTGEEQIPGLQGTNATLIVNGDLILSGGELDAGDQGMVIMCRNLFLGASGNFRGLLLVQNLAFISQDWTTTLPLSLRGALVCGRGKTLIETHPIDPITKEMGYDSFVMDSIGLNSAQFVYDARYCKGILKYGEWQLMSLRKVQ